MYYVVKASKVLNVLKHQNCFKTCFLPSLAVSKCIWSINLMISFFRRLFANLLLKWNKEYKTRKIKSINVKGLIMSFVCLAS
jgi:hypothetical protein